MRMVRAVSKAREGSRKTQSRDRLLNYWERVHSEDVLVGKHSWCVIEGDCLDRLRDLPDGSVQTCVTSPPYWGLRDFGVEGQIGLEPTPAMYVERLVAVFREVRRVLREDGTLWLNMGDSYVATQGGRQAAVGELPKDGRMRRNRRFAKSREDVDVGGWSDRQSGSSVVPPASCGLKPKDLIGIPWRVALALQADGWWLRSDIVWHKPNPMPESVTDRPTRAHEYVFLLAKRSRYFYDQQAIREPVTGNARTRGRGVTPKSSQPGSGVGANASFHAAEDKTVTSRNARSVWILHARTARPYRSGNKRRKLTLPTRLNDHRGSSKPWEDNGSGRNCRSVWLIPIQPYRAAHFATFPERLVEPCIKAGTSAKGGCQKCGSPWERVIEREFRPQADVSKERGFRGAAGQKPMDESNGWQGFPRGTTEATTKGWRPSCSCGDGDSVPQTVLDPFCGAGTTGLVALLHGRRFIGIELNQEYSHLARQRMGRECPEPGRDSKDGHQHASS